MDVGRHGAVFSLFSRPVSFFHPVMALQRRFLTQLTRKIRFTGFLGNSLYATESWFVAA